MSDQNPTAQEKQSYTLRKESYAARSTGLTTALPQEELLKPTKMKPKSDEKVVSIQLAQEALKEEKKSIENMWSALADGMTADQMRSMIMNSMKGYGFDPIAKYVQALDTLQGKELVSALKDFFALMGRTPQGMEQHELKKTKAASESGAGSRVTINVLRFSDLDPKILKERELIQRMKENRVEGEVSNLITEPPAADYSEFTAPTDKKKEIKNDKL